MVLKRASDFFLCFRSLAKDFHNLGQSNGAEEWRKREAQELGDLVQRRIYHLQVNSNTCMLFMAEKNFDLREGHHGKPFCSVFNTAIFFVY